MGILKKFTTAFFVGFAFLTAIFIGNALFPGKLFETAFSTLGVLMVFVALGLDTIFNLSSVD